MEDKKHYISARESRNIAKENAKEIKILKKKRAAYKKSDYITRMKDDRNIVEFDNLHTYFYTDSGVVKAVNGVSFDIPAGSTVGGGRRVRLRKVGHEFVAYAACSGTYGADRRRKHTFPFHG